jgi:hypothetical protein
VKNSYIALHCSAVPALHSLTPHCNGLEPQHPRHAAIARPELNSLLLLLLPSANLLLRLQPVHLQQQRLLYAM